MEHFIAYHSAQRMGYRLKPTKELRFLSKKLGLLKKAIGCTVWVVQGLQNGRKTAYTLLGAYIAKQVEREDLASDVYVIAGPRITELNPPLALNDLDWFPALLKSQSNFSLGFNRLNDQIVVQALSALQSGNSSETAAGLPDVDLVASGTEGSARLVSHLRRERKRTVVEAKKAATLSTKGNLACEACGFDFHAAYGVLGEGFCEVHHLTPLSTADGSVTTALEDLAILCSNCHRMVHRSDPMLTVAGLARMIAISTTRFNQLISAQTPSGNSSDADEISHDPVSSTASHRPQRQV